MLYKSKIYIKTFDQLPNIIMVKYHHCEKCRDVINTESWIGEVHVYYSICSSCREEEDQELIVDNSIDNVIQTEIDS